MEPTELEELVNYFRHSNKLLYLACPYSHPDSDVRYERCKLATNVAYDFFVKGIIVFSPLTYAMSLKICAELVDSTLENGWETWEKMDITFLDKCDALVVLLADGWDVSKGVQAEIKYAQDKCKPIFFLKYTI